MSAPEKCECKLFSLTWLYCLCKFHIRVRLVLHFSNYKNEMCAMNSLFWVWGKGGRTSSPREHKIFQPMCLFLLPLKVKAQKTYQMSHIAEPRPYSAVSNTLSFSPFPCCRLSVALPLSHILSSLRRLRPKRNRKPAQGLAFTVSQWHASLQQPHYMSLRHCRIQSWGQTPFWLKNRSSLHTSKPGSCLIVSPKTWLASQTAAY